MECRGLSFAYPDGPPVIHDVSLTVREGQILTLLGPNGAGKTTLVKHLNGLHRPSRGAVVLMGRDIGQSSTAEVSRHVGFVAQDVGGYLTRPTVREELELTLKLRGVGPAEWDRKVRRTLRLTGLENAGRADPRTLSCGGRRLVALAAMLVGDPRVLVLDEPTRGVDPEHRERLAALLEKYARRGGAVVLVTQDVEFAARVSDACAVMESGRVVARGDAHHILSGPGLYSTQTAALFRRAVKKMDGKGMVAGRMARTAVPLTPAELSETLRRADPPQAGGCEVRPAAGTIGGGAS